MLTRDEKKLVIEDIVERFMVIQNFEAKSMLIMIMSAYMEGKAAGKEEERLKWQQK